MRVLTFDLEHSYGIMRPWEYGFYLTCVVMVDNRGWSKVWWFDHISTEYNKTDSKKQMEEIQIQQFPVHWLLVNYKYTLRMSRPDFEVLIK